MSTTPTTRIPGHDEFCDCTSCTTVRILNREPDYTAEPDTDGRSAALAMDERTIGLAARKAQS